ncbi:MAG TPA: hypothetical protein PK357_00215 [Candidatus Pacearchaeota archaeon]|nr:hypothetical protein [Candidatus Pacearchaeota archaeon]
MKTFKPFEDLHFAKMKVNDKYVLIHTAFSDKLLSPSTSQFFFNLDYNSFSKYLQGACFGKDDKKIHLYNGIPENIKQSDFFPDKRFSCLEKGNLIKLLLDTGLNEDFGNSIKTIK